MLASLEDRTGGGNNAPVQGLGTSGRIGFNGRVSDRPRRPAYRDSAALEQLSPERGPDEVAEAAHSTAAALIAHGRSAADPEVTARLVRLVEEEGLDVLAELWADRPARSLPGALWRLYVLREWVRRDPAGAAHDYDTGYRTAMVEHVVAGVAEPPGPEQVGTMADAVLTGVFDGDLAVALERAAAFCHVVAAGRALRAGDEEVADPEAASQLTHRAASLQRTGEDLEAAASLWRNDKLV